MNIFRSNKASAEFEAAITAINHLIEIERQAEAFGTDRALNHRIMDQRAIVKAAVAAVKRPSEIAQLRAAWANR
jgi:hypothetical protein